MCYCCYQHRQVEAKINKLVTIFKPKTDYNNDLFHLYLTYIRRYRLSYFHLRQVEKICAIFAEDAWATISCWNDIDILARRYNVKHSNGKDNGCAVTKIGLMLTELGVLSPKEDDCSKHIAKKLKDLSHLDLYEDAIDLIDWLKWSGRRPATTYNYLCHIEKYGLWFKNICSREIVSPSDNSTRTCFNPLALDYLDHHVLP